jgi:hypothetical protein
MKMKRRDFLMTQTVGVVTAASGGFPSARLAMAQPMLATPSDPITSPNDTRLHVKPVMTNLIHTDVWEGPCRWKGVSPSEEAKNAGEAFGRWTRQLREKELGPLSHVHLLDPVQITFSEDFTIRREEFNKLLPDSQSTDIFYVNSLGSSLSAFEIGKRFGKPVLLKGLGCRNVDIAAYTRSQGCEAFVAADEAELNKILFGLRARKVFRSTRVLFPTDRGLPAVCSVGSITDLPDLERRLGVAVKTISYKSLSNEVRRVNADAATTRQAQQEAEELWRNAQHSFLDKQYVLKSYLFYHAVRNLMALYGCNAFTIECFELCSSRLPEQWQITPCLIHGLLKDQGYAASCEGDLGSLLAIRLLMSLSGKSCHQGNSDPKDQDTFRINHSNPALKMNGFSQPNLPYQLGRFVSKGWGTKLLVDFMNNQEKTVTVARVNPKASKMLVLRGELVGANGWGEDMIGCSVGAVIKPPRGRADEFLKKRLDYGNHLQWVYGDYTDDMRQVSEMLGLDVEVIR